MERPLSVVAKLLAVQAFFLAFAVAARFLPATFFTRLRAAIVLPRSVETFFLGIARLAFFLRVSTLRAERAPRAAGMNCSFYCRCTGASI